MDLLTRIQACFANSIATQQHALSSAGAAIAQAAERIAHCHLSGQGTGLWHWRPGSSISDHPCLCDLIERLVCAEENQR